MGRRTRNKPQGGLIASVEPGSLAARLNLLPGDRILAVNGKTLRDIIDYRYEIAEPQVWLKVRREDKTFTCTVEKEIDQDLGIHFELAVFDNIIECHNKCSFCFIHQMARGLRHSLYIMDDDYRLSFLQGNFITLTNLKAHDWKRIYQDRLTPLNVSVHTTNPSLRAEMIKHPQGGAINQQLRRLARHGIDFHAQIVFCPGFNDGAELDRTLRDLEKFKPHLQSIAVVPVGLTQFRTYLPKLEPVSAELARQTILQVKGWQKHYQTRWGDPTVRLGDEFYVIAGMKLPGHAHYGDYWQLGDGVGGGALMEHEFKRLAKHLPKCLEKSRSVTVVTGQAGERILRPLVSRLNEIDNLDVDLRVLISQFWGPQITVTGLLTFHDVVSTLRGQNLGDALVISRIMLKDGTDLMLDGKHVSDLAAALDIPVYAVENSARGLVAGVLGTAEASLPGGEFSYHGPYEPNLTLAALY
jgi:putative radical SAM enzyme (TIGR03279 family)